MRRYAAVLVVVFFGSPAWAAGWYLLAPPQRNGPLNYATSLAEFTKAVDDTAPYDAWDVVSSFDSANACTSYRTGLYAMRQQKNTEARDKAAKDFSSLSLSERVGLNTESKFQKAQCIASDDPRLLAGGVRKQWRLIAPTTPEKLRQPPKYLDDFLDKTAPPKLQEVMGTYPSEWVCEEAKESFLMGFLHFLNLKEVDRNELDLTRLDIKSQRAENLLGYLKLRDSQCIASDDPRFSAAASIASQ